MDRNAVKGKKGRDPECYLVYITLSNILHCPNEGVSEDAATGVVPCHCLTNHVMTCGIHANENSCPLVLVAPDTNTEAFPLKPGGSEDRLSMSGACNSPDEKHPELVCYHHERSVGEFCIPESGTKVKPRPCSNVPLALSFQPLAIVVLLHVDPTRTYVAERGSFWLLPLRCY